MLETLIFHASAIAAYPQQSAQLVVLEYIAGRHAIIRWIRFGARMKVTALLSALQCPNPYFSSVQESPTGQRTYPFLLNSSSVLPPTGAAFPGDSMSQSVMASWASCGREAYKMGSWIVEFHLDQGRWMIVSEVTEEWEGWLTRSDPA